MASYHLSAKIIGRSDGRSAVAAAAYRSGSLLDRDETGDTQDYRRKGGIVSADLLTPEYAPEWARDRSRLWNSVEAVETRKNSQLAREFELALPNELSEHQARSLVLEWARRELVARGMCADVCVHDPDPVPGKGRNRHAHVLCTVRGLDGDGWARTKDRTWNDKALLEHLRASWAEAQNAALQAAGCVDRVDHRSLADQRQAALDAGDLVGAEALDRPPEPRLGVAASAIEDRARREADRFREEYQPVTFRGRALQDARTLRGVLLTAVETVRTVALRVLDLFQAVSVPVEDPFSAPPKEPPEEAYDGLPGFG
jgi:hypothetical protein